MPNVAQSNFYCVRCANKVPLPRRRGQLREKGHLKSIYCIRCQEEINHLEVREFDLEFDLDKFKEEIAQGLYKDKEKKEG